LLCTFVFPRNFAKKEAFKNNALFSSRFFWRRFFASSIQDFLSAKIQEKKIQEYLFLSINEFATAMDTPNTPYPPQAPNNPEYPRYPRYETRYERRSRWWVPLLITLVIIFGFFALIAGVIVSIGAAFSSGDSAEVKSNSVLHLKFAGALEERQSENPFAFLTGGSSPPSFHDMLLALERAKNDKNIRGILIEGGISAGSAKLGEIRDALLEFKKSGKFIYAHISFGSERDYYIASVADSVFMPTEGLMEINGFSALGVFFKGALEKIGVDFYVEQFEEFKSAVEPYSRTGYSEPAKQELRELLEARQSEFVRAVAESRKMEISAIQATLKRGVYTPDSLLALGYIDGIRSVNALKDAIKRRVYDTAAQKSTSSSASGSDSSAASSDDSSSGDGEESDNDESASANFLLSQISQADNNGDGKDAKKADKAEQADKGEKDDIKNKKLRLVAVGRYVKSDSFVNAAKRDDKSKPDDDKQIAVIFASGTIVSSGDPDEQIVSSAFIRDMRKARDNKKIKAIIIRIDSPGGSSFASDEMWEEIRLAAREKPVYASMSDVAASGGYYMAMACDTIVAHPATITGSIGVLLLLPNASKMLEKIGVSVDTVATSPAAIDYDPALQLTEANKKRIHEQSAKIYRRFVERVAESRKKSFEETRAVAKGRVWTGAAAREQGLVDTLGGLTTAIGIAKRRLGIPESQRVVVRRYPSQELNRFERIMKRLMDDDETRAPSALAQMRAAFDAEMLAKNPLWKALPEAVRLQIQYLAELAVSNPEERTLLALPALPYIR
jgi:protease-4